MAQEHRFARRPHFALRRCRLRRFGRVPRSAVYPHCWLALTTGRLRYTYTATPVSGGSGAPGRTFVLRTCGTLPYYTSLVDAVCTGLVVVHSGYCGFWLDGRAVCRTSYSAMDPAPSPY